METTNCPTNHRHWKCEWQGAAWTKSSTKRWRKNGSRSHSLLTIVIVVDFLWYKQPKLHSRRKIRSMPTKAFWIQSLDSSTCANPSFRCEHDCWNERVRTVIRVHNDKPLLQMISFCLSASIHLSTRVPHESFPCPSQLLRSLVPRTRLGQDGRLVQRWHTLSRNVPTCDG